ncbi:MAG: hypothetical protein ACYSUJ_13955 [Planctomycetota bacterium]|jgi:hypothetical protein
MKKILFLTIVGLILFSSNTLFAEVPNSALEKQLEQIEAQLNREDVRHIARIAFLEHKKELALEEGNEEAVERIYLLLFRENELHNSFIQRLQERKEEILAQLG